MSNFIRKNKTHDPYNHEESRQYVHMVTTHTAHRQACPQYTKHNTQNTTANCPSVSAISNCKHSGGIPTAKIEYNNLNIDSSEIDSNFNSDFKLNINSYFYENFDCDLINRLKIDMPDEKAPPGDTTSPHRDPESGAQVQTNASDSDHEQQQGSPHQSQSQTSPRESDGSHQSDPSQEHPSGSKPQPSTSPAHRTSTDKHTSPAQHERYAPSPGTTNISPRQLLRQHRGRARPGRGRVGRKPSRPGRGAFASRFRFAKQSYDDLSSPANSDNDNHASSTTNDAIPTTSTAAFPLTTYIDGNGASITITNTEDINVIDVSCDDKNGNDGNDGNNDNSNKNNKKIKVKRDRRVYRLRGLEKENNNNFENIENIKINLENDGQVHHAPRSHVSNREQSTSGAEAITDELDNLDLDLNGIHTDADIDDDINNNKTDSKIDKKGKSEMITGIHHHIPDGEYNKFLLFRSLGRDDYIDYMRYREFKLRFGSNNSNDPPSIPGVRTDSISRHHYSRAAQQRRLQQKRRQSVSLQDKHQHEESPGPAPDFIVSPDKTKTTTTGVAPTVTATGSLPSTLRLGRTILGAGDDPDTDIDFKRNEKRKRKHKNKNKTNNKNNMNLNGEVDRNINLLNKEKNIKNIRNLKRRNNKSNDFYVDDYLFDNDIVIFVRTKVCIGNVSKNIPIE